MNISSADQLIPLTPQTAAILLALAAGPKYGYLIADRTRTELDGSVQLSPGSLYPTLNRLKLMGLIKLSGIETSAGSPHKRQIYELTPLGQQVLALETKRQARFVSLARARLRNRDAS